MISAISLSGVATYPKDPEEAVRIGGLRAQVLFFGDNGSGKTTISRVIAKPASYSGCSISAPQDTLFQVYNSDFVDVAYRESAYPGVFTLGEKAREVEEQIEALEKSRATLGSEIASYKNQIATTEEEEKEDRSNLADTVWDAKNLLDASLHDAFKGHLKSKVTLVDQVLTVAATTPAPVEGTLIERAKVLYGTPPPRKASLQPLGVEKFAELEAAEEWRRVLVGSEDVPLAKLINQLSSHDWVHRGLGYLEKSTECPFCQQAVPSKLKEDLERVFDKVYEEGVGRLRSLHADYVRQSTTIENALASIQSGLTASTGLDFGKLRAALAENRAAMERKVEAPSAPIVVTNTTGLLAQVQAAIEAQNGLTAEWNARLDNRAEEAKVLTSSVWQLLVSRVSTNTAQYREASERRVKKLGGLRTKLVAASEQLAAVEPQLRDLKSSLASVEGTVTKINDLLERFGFTGFRLKVSEDKKRYVVVRDNGDQVTRTLSEGEKTLVSFLYFYYLAQGGLVESETDRRRVLVIDDPISSLDANVLFLVSTLVREMLSWTKEDHGLVQQVIVLTHNAYFHKEVATERRDGLNLQYWMVRKYSGVSGVEVCAKNPIKSSYSLLWSTVRGAREGKEVEHHTLANSMRRILENYFCFLGGSWDSGLRNKFKGEDLTVLNALISWLHDGSHRVFEGLEIGPGHSPAQYLLVFEQIFEHSGHSAHFEMMMKSEAS